MKRLLPLIYLSLMLMAAASCGCYKHLPPVQTNIRDSLVLNIKDSTVIHIDTVTVEIPKESSTAILPQEQSSHLETSVAESDAFVDSTGLLHHSINNKAGVSVKAEVPVIEHFHSEDAFEHHLEHETVTVTVEVEKKLTKWQQFKMNVGGWACGIIFLALLLLGIYAACKIWPGSRLASWMKFLLRFVNR